ncbi:MAG: CopD family protein [Flavobacteriia bacterium]|jgi:putative membrane protein|nr:CopD family protein [Flavobacteriia bacterium]
MEDFQSYFTIYKSLHIIFMVSWFAGLFYMVRLFIYHVEANEKPEPEKSILIQQFSIMQKRLWWIITTPAMVLTVVFGVCMLVANPTFLLAPYMRLKLGFVALLIVYHFISQKIYFDLKANTFFWSSGMLRIWNEVATLMLVIIVFIVVLKETMNWIYATIGFFSVALLLMFAIKMYKSFRRNKEKE